MKEHIKIVTLNNIKRGSNTGCGECQAACQSACKTSCTVGNVPCEKLQSAHIEANGQKGK